MIEEDLEAFLDVDEFAETFRLPKQRSTFNGIFDNEYLEISGAGGTTPVISCREEDVKDVARGDVIYRESSGKKFYFIKSETDGVGMTRVVLEDA